MKIFQKMLMSSKHLHLLLEFVELSYGLYFPENNNLFIDLLLVSYLFSNNLSF